MNAGFGRTRPRGWFIAMLLLLTLGLAGVIALEAHRTFLVHRATAEGILQDYARLAANRFANRTAMALYYESFSPAIDALMRATAGARGGPLPTPEHLAAGLDWHHSGFLRAARFAFRYDLHTGGLETAGDAPSRAARKWLLDTLPAHRRTVYDPKERLAAIVRTVDGVPHAIAYTVVTDKAGAPRTMLGFDGDPKGFESLYTNPKEKFPLLPPMLTGGVVYDSLGSMIVTDANGVELYRSPVQYTPTFAARDSIEAIVGGMWVQVALRPDIAPKLIIGGMPRSRLPWLLALLALTAGLIIAALLQLRREYELSRLRADFVSGVSHELRTPLAQIRMFSETLLLGRVRSQEERVRSLEIIDQEARRLTHLVENVLHFSRAERQVTRLSPASTPLAPLVSEVVEGFGPLAAARGVALRTELTEGVLAPVDADALRQTLLNLLDNAVKYGPEGQTVTVGLAAGDGCARISVTDEGPGIPAADRDRIWQQFYRLERDRGSAVAGTGIGLSVVREIVALHNGRCWVEDGGLTTGADGRGARFVIELPLMTASERASDSGPGERAAPGAATGRAGVPA